MAGFELDLRKLLPKGAAGAVGRAVRAGERIDALGDRVAAPLADGRARRCTVPARGRLVALADDRRTAGGEAGGQGIEVAFLRLAVGDGETCVRQFVPYALRAQLRLGDELAVLAHDADPAIAIADWGTAEGQVASAIQFGWPAREEWPAPGTVAVRDNGRHARAAARRRADWTPAAATLLEASSRGGLTDKREDWRLVLDTGGRRAEVRERVPWLAVAHVAERIEHRGRMVTRYERRARAGAPLAVLVAPGGEVAVDWAATLTALLT